MPRRRIQSMIFNVSALLRRGCSLSSVPTLVSQGTFPVAPSHQPGSSAPPLSPATNPGLWGPPLSPVHTLVPQAFLFFWPLSYPCPHSRCRWQGVPNPDQTGTAPAFTAFQPSDKYVTRQSNKSVISHSFV
jgi:hypothetical protein